MSDMTTSGSGAAKLNRAINHIANSIKLIASLPDAYRQGNDRNKVRLIIDRLNAIEDELRSLQKKIGNNS
jgi:hypothetical protein